MGNVHGKKKEGNAKSQIIVNSYDNYNAPVDNKNIAYLEIPKEVDNPRVVLYKNETSIYKCFQMTPGIWVTNVDTSDENSKIDQKTIETYNQYLKNISLYFRRLNLFDIGQRFFQFISQASPYKFYKEFYNNDKDSKRKFKNKIATVYVVKKNKPSKRIGVANLSILIVLNRNRQSVSYKMMNLGSDNSRKIYGDIGIVEMKMTNISKYTFNDNSGYFFVDPIIILFHELIHAMHYIYDYNCAHKSFEIGKHNYNLEEVITHGGGKDISLLQKKINDHNNWYINDIGKVVYNLNHSGKSESFKDFYARKYCLEKNGKEYTLTRNAAQKLINLLQTTFTETLLSDSISAPRRDSYYDVTSQYYFFNPYDKRFYDFHDGLQQKQFSNYVIEKQIKPEKVELVY